MAEKQWKRDLFAINTSGNPYDIGDQIEFRIWEATDGTTQLELDGTTFNADNLGGSSGLPVYDLYDYVELNSQDEQYYVKTEYQDVDFWTASDFCLSDNKVLPNYGAIYYYMGGPGSIMYGAFLMDNVLDHDQFFAYWTINKTTWKVECHRVSLVNIDEQDSVLRKIYYGQNQYKVNSVEVLELVNTQESGSILKASPVRMFLDTKSLDAFLQYKGSGWNRETLITNFNEGSNEVKIGIIGQLSTYCDSMRWSGDSVLHYVADKFIVADISNSTPELAVKDISSELADAILRWA